MTDQSSAFGIQGDIRQPWRRFLDDLAPLRPQLHGYCCRLTGNVWDGEDLVQDSLLRVFGLLGKMDADLDNPRGYLIRTATNLWIDRMRRRDRERDLLVSQAADIEGAPAGAPPEQSAEVRSAAGQLLQLAPRERAAVLLKDVFDLSLTETASVLKTTVGAVKAALHRGRSRLQEEGGGVTMQSSSPRREIIDRFVTAMAAKDIEGLRTLCSEDLTIEMVGGAQMDSFEKGRIFFEHAHMVFPELGFGENPRWEVAEYRGEIVAIGFRTLDGIEGLNEIHRLEELDGVVTRIRCYCFCPDTLKTVADELGIKSLRRPYRSPG